LLLFACLHGLLLLIVLCCAVLCCAVLCCAVLCCAVLIFIDVLCSFSAAGEGEEGLEQLAG